MIESMQPSHGYTGQPPAKRSKMNPIITRYPPPPGYIPGQPGPWQQNAGAYGPLTPMNRYNPSQQAYPGSHHQPYPQHQQIHPPQSHSDQPPGTYSKPRQQFIPHPPHHIFPPRKHVSPSVTTSTSLETPYGSEAVYTRCPEEIDPRFSLGLITWHAPMPTRFPLPATYQEADLEALAQRNHKRELDSISEYFTSDKLHEVGLNVRQTERWKEVCHDGIYKEFPRVPDKVLSFEEVRAKYRNRPQLEKPGDLGRPLDGIIEVEGRGGDVLRDEEQERALERLGVTGSPKPLGENRRVSFLLAESKKRNHGHLADDEDELIPRRKHSRA
ncbi:hypothetical protein K470DRAFT_276638 [Piedraia hortae CBS 480.64]|uniref:Uncharacterized protein n=1 Tax=Piedraia hortae CBS 480.64 TaxID=1314780 RepID=A0A6A7BZQ6_9PEZI|nr:hypothetical protein K470DRAFT_276638 [Piedraia hortae CBS 480.64]